MSPVKATGRFRKEASAQNGAGFRAPTSAVGNRAHGGIQCHLPESFRKIPLFAPMQRKLKVGAVDDALEMEADRVAEHVMRTPEPSALRRKCKDCKQEDENIRRMQRKEAGSGAQAEAPASVDETLAAPGVPLDESARAFFERRFDRDFSHVRIHADANAASSANAVDARAYTVGNHIAFAAGEYNPSNHSGRLLMAHELAHVVQQGASPQQAVRRDDKKPAASPEITISPRTGPTPKDCDAFSWTINWVINPKTEKGGWLIQHIDGKFDITDCKGKKVDSVCCIWDYW